MPNLSIKNVPADVIVGLRERASANHRSLQGELLALVTQVVTNPGSVSGAETVQRARKGYKSIEQIAQEHRQLKKRPYRKGPHSTELIRQDRDAR
ncbi:Arc family DNA-binding protein [Marinihelvus fidelis]|uniref:Arc family DNA-binding protein n=2 Tax=Marinihelvus fidelis TaxID=2613842 RepID=A0A5N0TCG1_9GAMM|nr:Arc family DNA-binding protein [Marinihelvus fidelis]